MSFRPAWWHPSERRLRAWLYAASPDAVTEHVERCERCADRLEALDAAAPVFSLDEPSAVRQALTDLFAPPHDLTERVVAQVGERTTQRADLSLFADLFSIGVETAQILLEPPGSNPGDDIARRSDATTNKEIR